MSVGTAAKPKRSKTKGSTFAISNEDLDRIEKDADEQMQQIRNGKRPKADPPATKDESAKPTDAANLLAGVEVIDERDVEYAHIIRSRHNPRLSFDEELIAELAPNIETICKMNPLTVREGSFELIDGETRHRAGAVAKVKRLRCKIVRCTDAQAACIRLQTSVQRRDLNAIEKAKALKSLQEEHGFSQRQLSPIVNLKQGSIANYTRLLELPDEWLEMISEEIITAAAARELVPYAKEAAMLKYLDKSLKQLPTEERSIALSEQLAIAIDQNSRPLKNGYFWDRKLNRNRSVNLDPTPEQREQLRVHTIKRYGTMKFDICFNIELWEELQTADEKAAEERAKKREDKRAAAGGSTGQASGKKLDAQALKQQREQQEKIFAKKIYRYRIDWFQRKLLGKVPGFNERDLLRLAIAYACAEGYSHRQNDVCSMVNPGYKGRLLTLTSEIERIWEMTAQQASQIIVKFVGSSFEGYHPALQPAALETIAKANGVDLKEDWPKSCKAPGSTELEGYLAILSKSQVIDLIAEWNLAVKYTDSTKRSELVDQVAEAGKGKPTPKLLLNAKPVSLT